MDPLHFHRSSAREGFQQLAAKQKEGESGRYTVLNNISLDIAHASMICGV